MQLRSPVVLAAALCAAVSIQPHQDEQVRAADDLYPAERATEVVRFLFVTTDEPDMGEVNKALRELGAKVAYGPRTTEARPGRAFFALSAPVDVTTAKLERALHRVGGTAKALECTAFDGRDDRDKRVDVAGFKMTSRDIVMGMSGEIIWFDSAGGWSQFYGLPGKLEAEELLERYEKLYAPFGGGKLGQLVQERFTWTLGVAPDKPRADKLLKAVRKLAGVRKATIEGTALCVEVALEGLGANGVAGKVPAGPEAKDELDAAGLAAPRACFTTRPLWDLLEAEGLAPSVREPAKDR